MSETHESESGPTRQPTVLIAMPVYEGWEYVAEALDSVRAQTYQHYHVLISVDGADERSFAMCQPYTADPRVELVLQPDRLHWEGNMNWLAARLKQDFFCYWQHDDYCRPEYLQRLIDHAERHPQASAVYCDMQCFGARDDIIQYPSVTGFALERVLKQAATNNPAVIRCLIRADAMRAALPIKLASTWSVALARSGELHRVPDILYFRRRPPNSWTAQKLADRPKQELWAATLEWGLGVMEVAAPLVQQDELFRLLVMTIDQLVYKQVRGRWQVNFRQTDKATRLRFVAELVSEARRRLSMDPFSLAVANQEAAIAASKKGSGHQEAVALLIEAMPGIGTAVNP